ncbi:maleylacetate reductase [Sporothrix schenckii 1099-18]|uniref:Maleylacetate reductase n=1 Tax=Sporothrix schenckii 1099-18 TaxID=1397361 RepID=A0A0F2MKC9_SPOSC|nr:maleylacetate reductase [Sporothrix schenckii 1099-18]KJR89295.1 maleylacetate reductase [Sporothrix schenckii 1099-18]
MSFQHFNVPRVVFGRGTLAKLPEEAALLGGKGAKAFLLSTPQQADQLDRIKALLAGSDVGVAGVFTEAAMHTPAGITEKALAALAAASPATAGASPNDNNNNVVLVSMGGGSTIGLGKAMAIRTGRAHLCIPTSYAGSEMTPILGETADGRKTTRSDPRILPRTVLYDVDLTGTLPRTMRATSGINALAHAVEALYTQNASPVVAALAAEAIRSLAVALPQLAEDGAEDDDATPGDKTAARQKAEEDALYGAWLCGMCLGNVSMSIHHKLCHVLGGSFNLPHGETHTAVLPHSLSYVAPRIGGVMATLAGLLPESHGDAVAGLNALLAKLPVQLALRDYGFREEDIDKAADIALAQPYWSPRPLEREAIREVIRRIWAGEPARADL